MAPVFVQKKFTSTSGSATTTTVTPTTAPVNGNFAFLQATWGNITTTGLSTALKDNNGVAATLIDDTTQSGGPVGTAAYYVASISGSPTSWTFTSPGGSSGPIGISYQEWSGVGALDAHAIQVVNGGTNSSTQTSPSATATVAGDLAIGYISGPESGFSDFNSASFSATGTGATIRNNDSPVDVIADSSQIQTSSGASTATFTLAAANLYQVGIALFKAASSAAPTWGFSASPQNERTLPIQRTDWSATTWFRPSQIPVPQQWQPTTGMEDRPPEPKNRPDDSSIEFEQWFVQSPNPVPTRWLSTTGEEDRRPPIKRPPDEPFVWFVRSSVPVPITWLPTTGEEDRPPHPNRIRSPDEPYPWFVRSPNPVPIIWLPTTGEEDRPPALKRPPDEPGNFFFQKQVAATIWGPVSYQDGFVKPLQRPPAETFPWFVRSSSPVPIIWLPITGQEDRPPPPRSRPDDSVIEEPQWFARSSNPVPTTWLPQWDGGEKPKQISLDPSQLVLPVFVSIPIQFAYAQTNADDFNPLKPFQWGDHPLTWAPKSFATPVGISGIAWYSPYSDKEKLPATKRPPDEPFLWFVRSPVPVPTSWLPQWDGWERPRPVPPDASLTAFSFKTPAVVSTISGIAWLNLSDATRLPRIIGDPYAVQTLPFFIEPPLIPFYAAANADDFNPLPKAPPDASLTAFSFKTPIVVATPNIGWQRADVPVSQVFFYSPDTVTSWPPQPIAPPVGISGISWWRQTEVYVGPLPPQLDYIISWNPQFITPPVAGTLLLRTLMGMGR